MDDTRLVRIDVPGNPFNNSRRRPTTDGQQEEEGELEGSGTRREGWEDMVGEEDRRREIGFRGPESRTISGGRRRTTDKQKRGRES